MISELGPATPGSETTHPARATVALVQFLVVALLVPLIPWMVADAASAQPATPTVPAAPADLQSFVAPAQAFDSTGAPDDAPVRFTGATGTLMPIPDGGSGYGRTAQLVTGDLNGDLIEDVVAVRDVFNANRSALAIALGAGDGTLAAPAFVDLDSSLTVNQRGGLDLADLDGDGALDIAIGVHNPALTRVFLNDGTGGFVDSAERTIDLITDEPRNLVADDVDGDGNVDLTIIESAGSSWTLNLYRNLGGGAFDTGTEVFASTRSIMSVAIGDLTADGLADIVVADDQSTVNVFVQRAVDADPANNVFDNDGEESELNDGDGLSGNATQLWVTPDLTADTHADVVIVSRDDRGCLSTVNSRSCLVVAAGDGSGGLSSPEAVDEDEDDVDDTGRSAPLRDTYYTDHPTTPPAPADFDGDGSLEFVIFGNDPYVQVAEVDPAGAIETKRLVTGNGSGPDETQSATVNGATNNDALFVGGAGVADLDLDGRPDILIGQSIGTYSNYTADITWIRNDPGFPTGFRTGFTVDVVDAPLNDRRSEDDTVLVDWSRDGVLDLVTFETGLDLVVAEGLGDGTFADAEVAAVDPTADVDGCRSGASADVIDAPHADDFDGDGAVDLGYISNDGTTSHLCVLYGDGSGGVDSAVATVGVGTDITFDAVEWIDYDADGDVDALSREAVDADTTIVLYRNNADGGAFTAIPVLDIPDQRRFAIGVGDVNGDGRADLVRRTGSASADALHTHLQGVDGTLGATSVDTTPLPESAFVAVGVMAIADFDGDGDGDLIYNHEGNQFAGRGLRSYVATSNGDGTFTVPDDDSNIHVVSNRSTRYRVVDIDGDSDLDVVTASYGLGVEVLVNSGEGDIHTGDRFDGPFRYSNGQVVPSTLLLGDLDGDDDIDAITQLTNPSTPRPVDLYTVLLQIPGAPPSGGGNPDLTASDVVATPDAVVAGDDTTVSYSADNDGDVAAIGPWVDAVYLSTDDSWDVNDRLLATVDRPGPLGPGESENVEVPVVVDPVTLGDNQVIVRTDVRNTVVESDDGNNVAVAAAPLGVSIPVIDGTLDVVVSPGENAYAQIPVSADQPLLLTVTGPGGGADVDVVRDAIPVPRRQLQVPDRSSFERRLGLPAGEAATWFVRVRGDAGLVGPTTYTLAVEELDFGIVSIAPEVVANNGPATVVITGAGFSSDATVTLDGPATAEAASTEASDDGARLTATFQWGPLSGEDTNVPTGFYDLTVADGDESATVTDGVRVIDGAGGAEPETRAGLTNPCYITGESGGSSGEACTVFEFVANAPQELRRLAGTSGTPGYFLYQNRARIDIPRPFVEIYNKGVELSTDGGATWTQGGFELPIPNLGAVDDVLPAGISGRIDFRIRASESAIDDGVEVLNDFVLGHQTYAPYDYSGLVTSPAIGEFERVLGVGSDATRAVSDVYLDAVEGPNKELAYYTPDEYGFEFIPGYPMECVVLTTGSGKKIGNPCRDFRPQAHWAVRNLRTTTQHDYLMGVHGIIAEARGGGYDGPFTRAFGEGLLRNLALGTAPGAPVHGVVTVDGEPMPIPPVLARTGLDEEGLQDYAGGFGWLDGHYNLWDVPTDTPLDVWVDGMIPDPTETVTIGPDESATVDLAVSVGNTISGVVAIDGVPSADVIVTTDLASGFERQVLSDEDGTYQLTGLDIAEYEVAFEHPRIAPTERTVDVAAGDNVLDVDIASLGSVTGTVSAVGGGALSGASVRIVPAEAPDGMDPAEQSGIEAATTAGDGSYVLDGMDPGDYLVFARADGYVERSAPVTVASSTESADLELDPAATLTGLVADADGAPVPDAAVFVETVDQEAMLGETLTEDDGSYRIEGVPAGEVVVTALGSEESSVVTVSLTAEAAITHEVDLSFPPIGDVSVLVVNGAGDPVAGVRAEIVGGASGEQLLGTGNTGTGGRVVIEGVPVDGSTVVIGGVVSEPVPAGHDGTVPIEIVIDVAQVRGRLLDAGDEPIDEVEVLLLRDGESVATTLTSETGDFDFHVTAAGDYEVVADPPSGLRRREVVVTPGTDADLGTVAPGPHSIELTLDLDDGDEVEVLEYHAVEMPLPGVSDPRLVLRRFLSEDDPALFEGLPPGLHQVTARNAARYIDEAVEVDGAESLEVGDSDTGRILGTLTGSDGEPVAARIDALASGIAPVLDYSADDGTYSTGLAPGTYDLLIRAQETGEAIRVEGVVVEAGQDLVVDVQTSDASAIDVSPDSVGVLEAGAHVSVLDVDTDVHFDAYGGNARFESLPPGDYRVEVRVDGHLPWVESVTVGAEDVEIVGSVGTPVALAPGYEFDSASGGAAVGATSAEGDGRPASELVEPPSRTDGPIAAMGINDVVTAEDVEFAVDFVQTGAGTAIETVKQKLALVEPQRDPREAELRERLEHLKRKLDVRRTKNVSACRSTISSQKAAIKWDERKEQFFQAWVDRHGDLDRVIRDVKFRTALTLLSAAIAAISIFVAVVVLAPLAIEGGIIATALAALNTALGTTVIGSFTLAQFSALLSFILGLGPALVEGVDGFLNEAASADATSFFKSLLFVIRGMVEKLFSIAFLPLSILGFNPSPFEMSAGFLALGTALEGEGKKYRNAQDEIDDLIDQAKATDVELKALAKQKSDVLSQLERAEATLRGRQSYVRMADYSKEAIAEVESQAKKRNALRAELDRLNQIPDTNPQAERIAHLRNNRSGFAVFGEFLGAAGGAVLDVVSYFEALENQLAALRALDEQLLNGSDRYDAAERAYKTAINNSTLEVERSTKSLLRPDCIDPIDPDDWDNVVNGYYIRPKDPNEIVGPLGGGDEHALKATPPDLTYAIFFENLGPGSEVIPPGEEIAEVSAARVTIETGLDDDVDPDTVLLGDVQIGEVVIDVPDGLSAYQEVHGPYDDPGGEAGQILIEVEGEVVDGSIRWVLTALDPDTGFVVGDRRGLLPPEDGTDIGKGSVGYSVSPSGGSGNGTVVTAQASIVFDDNEAIVTNTWSNVFDSDVPDAHVVDAPAVADLPFELQWDSSDPTSSVVSVDVYVRFDGEFVRIKRVDDTGSTTITEDDFTFGYEPTPVEVQEDQVLVAADAPVDFAVSAIDAAGNSEVTPPEDAEATIELGTGFGAEADPDPDPGGDSISFDSSRVTVNGRYAPVAGDFDGDGDGDVLWYAPGSSADHLWLSGGDGTFDSTPTTVNGRYRPVAGDFDGDGDTDILWYAPGRVPDFLWLSRGDGTFVSRSIDVVGDYEPVAGDFDGDGDTDVLWYAPGHAADHLWSSRGDGTFRSSRMTVNGDYAPVAGDFDGDGDGDVLWYAPGSSADHLWLSGGDGTFDSTPTTVNGRYRPVAGDFDGDGDTDVLWYAPGEGADHLWSSRADGTFGQSSVTVAGDYLPVPGDFDGDDDTDIIWYAPGRAPDHLWSVGA